MPSLQLLLLPFTPHFPSGRPVQPSHRLGLGLGDEANKTMRSQQETDLIHASPPGRLASPRGGRQTITCVKRTVDAPTYAQHLSLTEGYTGSGSGSSSASHTFENYH